MQINEKKYPHGYGHCIMVGINDFKKNIFCFFSPDEFKKCFSCMSTAAPKRCRLAELRLIFTHCNCVEGESMIL